MVGDSVDTGDTGDTDLGLVEKKRKSKNLQNDLKEKNVKIFFSISSVKGVVFFYLRSKCMSLSILVFITMRSM